MLDSEERNKLQAAFKEALVAARDLETRFIQLSTDKVNPHDLLAEGHLDQRIRLCIEEGIAVPTTLNLTGIFANKQPFLETAGCRPAQKQCYMQIPYGEEHGISATNRELQSGINKFASRPDARVRGNCPTTNL